MRAAAIPSLIILLGIVGCATTGTVHVSKGEELLANSQKCISSFDQVVYEQMTLWGLHKFTFDEQTAILQEGDRRRFVKGFVLPAEKGAYTVSITSYKQGTVYDPAIMYPEVRLLDKNHRIIRTLPHSDFVYRSLGTREGLNSVFFINHNSQGESFLLITNRPMDEADLTASQVNIQSSTPIVVPFPGGFAMWFIQTGSTTPPIKMKASATGPVEVELKEYRPKKVGE